MSPDPSVRAAAQSMMSDASIVSTSTASASASAMDYVRLMKPRVMSLVIFTALVGLVAAPVAMHPFTAAVAVFALALGSGAAGALNMWYDADIDALMARTVSRWLIKEPPLSRLLPR